MTFSIGAFVMSPGYCILRRLVIKEGMPLDVGTPSFDDKHLVALT